MGEINMLDTLNAFRGRRVFVTGHTGFKGSWLTFLLTEIGADVMGYALPPETERSHFELLQLDRRIRHVEGDIRDVSRLTDTLIGFRPEYVFHLAAQALVRRSYAEPVTTFHTNVLGSVHLLDAVRRCDSVRSLVYITSDKCYENVEWIWGYRENDRLGGSDPYSASKAAAEMAFSAYTRSYFSERSNLGVGTARAGNVIGGGDWSADRILPDCVRAAQEDRVIELRYPNATRPWQHVLEPISGYLVLADSIARLPHLSGKSWNFGPSSSSVRTVYEVANNVLKYLGHGRIATDKQIPSHKEARLLQLCCDQAHQELGWRPRWDVDRAVKETSIWYREVLEGANAAATTKAQVYRYFQELR